jgi:Ca-activated chloride channel homolog
MIRKHPEIAAITLLVLLATASGFSGEQEPAKKVEDIHTIRAEVNMVSLPVVVTDTAGRRILDLEKEDFSVFENGVQQEIAGFGATDEPLKIVLLLDTSGSTEYRLAKIQNAAIEFVNQLHPDDEVAVLSFANEVTLQQDFSIDRDKNEYGIKKTRTGEWTVLYEAVWLALEDVLKPVIERKALVLFSDGVDTRSGKASKNETLELAIETRATIYCVYYDTQADTNNKPKGPTWQKFPPIIIGPAPDPQDPDRSMQYQIGRSYLAKLAENSGGLMFDGSEDLHYAFVQIAKELASQYSIGYYPSNVKNEGKFRKIEVKVNRPGLAVRTKKGYYSKKEKRK